MGDVAGWVQDETSKALRRAALRRQVEALTALRDAVERESEADYERFAAALMPLTDAILHELMALEGVPPYPHPMGTWERLLAEFRASGGSRTREPGAGQEVEG